jgi:hypothetical protein
MITEIDVSRDNLGKNVAFDPNKHKRVHENTPVKGKILHIASKIEKIDTYLPSH